MRILSTILIVLLWASSELAFGQTQAEIDSQMDAEMAKMTCAMGDSQCDQLRNWILSVMDAILDVKSDCVSEGATQAQLDNCQGGWILGGVSWTLAYEDLDNDAIPNEGYADSDYADATTAWNLQLYASAAPLYESAAYFYNEAAAGYDAASWDFWNASGHYESSLSAYEMLLMELIM